MWRINNLHRSDPPDTGTSRVLAGPLNNPTSGKGIETVFDSSGDQGYMISFDRGGTGYKPLTIRGSKLLFNDLGGNVGIGTTTPETALDVKGSLTVRSVGGWWPGSEAIINIGDPNHYIKTIHNDGIRIGSYGVPDVIAIKQVSGLVGIGTTDPTERLDVEGKLCVGTSPNKANIETGNGVPSHPAPKGTLYVNTGANAPNTRLYINIGGSWAHIMAAL